MLRRLLRVLNGIIEWNTNWTGLSSVPVRGQVTYFKNEAVSKTYLPVGKVGYCDARSRNLSG